MLSLRSARLAFRVQQGPGSVCSSLGLAGNSLIASQEEQGRANQAASSQCSSSYTTLALNTLLKEDEEQQQQQSWGPMLRLSLTPASLLPAAAQAALAQMAASAMSMVAAGAPSAPLMAARRLKQQPEPFEAEFDEDEHEGGEFEELEDWGEWEETEVLEYEEWGNYEVEIEEGEDAKQQEGQKELPAAK